MISFHIVSNTPAVIAGTAGRWLRLLWPSGTGHASGRRAVPLPPVMAKPQVARRRGGTRGLVVGSGNACGNYVATSKADLEGRKLPLRTYARRLAIG